MALLTTEEVLNKTFGSVKFREGYDQAEVDEFLDEVVETIYALQVENADLKQQLEAAQARIAELESGAPVVVEAPVPVVEEAPVVETPAVPVTEPAVSTEVPDATSMLALAQRVHDEHIREGKEQSARIISEAHAQSETIISDAENKRNEILAQLEADRNLLEGKINELKSFEADYRNRMREHLQHLLGEL